MPLTPGTTLGPYSVTAKIGEGGMGEVRPVVRRLVVLPTRSAVQRTDKRLETC